MMFIFSVVISYQNFDVLTYSLTHFFFFFFLIIFHLHSYPQNSTLFPCLPKSLLQLATFLFLCLFLFLVSFLALQFINTQKEIHKVSIPFNIILFVASLLFSGEFYFLIFFSFLKLYFNPK